MAGVKDAAASVGTKEAVVEFDPKLTDVQQIAAAVAATPGLHGEPYKAGLLLAAAGLKPDNAEPVSKAIKGVKGVAEAKADAAAGRITVTFTPEGKAKLGQIIKAVNDANLGVKVKPYTPGTAKS